MWLRQSLGIFSILLIHLAMVGLGGRNLFADPLSEPALSSGNATGSSVNSLPDNLSAGINDEIHYMGKVVFPISGTAESVEGQCQWTVEGGVTLVLSFSKSTSMAGFIIKRRDIPVVESEQCPDRERTQSFKVPLTVNIEDRSFFAVDSKSVSRIVGTTGQLQVEGSYEHEYSNSELGVRERWSGTFSTRLKEIPGEIINVDQIKGSVISSIPMGIADVSDSIPDASTIVTAENSSATLHEKYGSRINVRAKTVVTRLPIKKLFNREIRRYMLINGGLDSNVSIQERNFEVVTPIARIKPDNQLIGLNRRDESENTQFSTDYQADDNGGSLTVSVSSGSVVVTSQEGEETAVISGEEFSLNANTNRTSWVQPADGGVFYGGIENMLAWTAYPGAYQYFLEYNFPNPIFSEDNPEAPEFIQQAIQVTPDMFSLWENLVIFPILLPDLPETTVEVRIYPQDEQGNILSTSVSSDRATMLFQ